MKKNVWSLGVALLLSILAVSSSLKASDEAEIDEVKKINADLATAHAAGGTIFSPEAKHHILGFNYKRLEKIAEGFETWAPQSQMSVFVKARLIVPEIYSWESPFAKQASYLSYCQANGTSFYLDEFKTKKGRDLSELGNQEFQKLKGELQALMSRMEKKVTKSFVTVGNPVPMTLNASQFEEYYVQVAARVGRLIKKNGCEVSQLASETIDEESIFQILAEADSSDTEDLAKLASEGRAKMNALILDAKAFSRNVDAFADKNGVTDDEQMQDSIWEARNLVASLEAQNTLFYLDHRAALQLLKHLGKGDCE